MGGVDRRRLQRGDFESARDLPAAIRNPRKHGLHLPLGTDLLNARYVSEHTAQEECSIIFPEYFAGQIFEAKHEPGTIAYSPELQLRLPQETTDEMARNGCKKVVIVNAHGGNEYLLPYFAQSQLYKPHDYVVYVQWGHESGRKAGTEKPGPDFHAGETETSRLMVTAQTLYTWIELQVNQAQIKSASSSRRVCSQASGGTRDFLTTIPVTDSRDARARPGGRRELGRDRSASHPCDQGRRREPEATKGV